MPVPKGKASFTTLTRFPMRTMSIPNTPTHRRFLPRNGHNITKDDFNDARREALVSTTVLHQTGHAVGHVIYHIYVKVESKDPFQYSRIVMMVCTPA